MAKIPNIDTKFLIDLLVKLLNTPSPTGYTDQAVALIEEAMAGFADIELRRTRKGALVATWNGESNESARGLTAHVDTLGAMVKEIKEKKEAGRLKLTAIGGFAWNTVEGEGCTVFTSKGEQVRGTILLTTASGHVHAAKVNETKRTDDTMEVRLDAITSSEKETRALGIEVGDFVAFDPRVEVNNGFIRSRHLD
ncbi:MAG: peptidase M42, partial [Chloroflexota bacterium]